jgi:hypothetical protein
MPDRVLQYTLYNYLLEPRGVPFSYLRPQIFDMYTDSVTHKVACGEQDEIVLRLRLIGRWSTFHYSRARDDVILKPLFVLLITLQKAFS